MTVLVTALVLAGCAGEDDEGSTGLLDALAKVRATEDSRRMVEFGAPSRLPDGDRFMRLVGYGYGQLAPSAELVREEVGLDLAAFDAGVVAGQPPRWVGAVWGDYDSAKVEGRLADLGAKREGQEFGGGTVWRSAEDDEVNVKDGPFKGIVRLNEFNTVHTSGTSFAYSPSAVGLDWVANPGDSTLAGDDVIGPLARCLGDVVAANLTGEGQGVGVRADGTEVVCLDAERAAVERALAGDVPSTRQPWDELLPNAEVDESDGRTRITVPPSDDRPAGRVLQLLHTQDVRALG